MNNSEIESWVADVARYTRPAAVHWCNGSREEADELIRPMRASGTLERLDEARHPRSFLYSSWLAEHERGETHLAKLEDKLPCATWAEHRSFRDRLRASIS